MSPWILLSMVAPLSGIAQESIAGSEAEIHEIEVQVGELSVQALCTEGRRRVVLLQGTYASAERWRPALERLPAGVGACAYERASTTEARGAAEAQGEPEARGWFELLDELRRVHEALGFEQGYVLVGHGLGGLYARLYAADRRQEVGGLVLLEPVHEELPALMLPAMPQGAWEEWMEERSTTNRDGVRESTLAERARRARLPDIPVTVLTATNRSVPDDWDARFVNEAARQAHASILRGLTAGRHVPARRAGRDILADEPDLVADEIARVVRIADRP